MVLYSSLVALYCMKWLQSIQIIRIIRIIFRYSNIRIMSFKFWILFVIRFGHFLPTNIIRLFDSLQNDYSWQHWTNPVCFWHKVWAVTYGLCNLLTTFLVHAKLGQSCLHDRVFDGTEDQLDVLRIWGKNNVRIVPIPTCGAREVRINDLLGVGI